MGDNKNCTVCNMKLDIVNYLKHRTVCKTCYNKNRRKKINKQKFYADVKNVFEPVTKDISDSSKEIPLALEGLKNKLLEALELQEVLDLIHSRIPKTPRK